MNKKFSINEILNAVDSINPNEAVTKINIERVVEKNINKTLSYKANKKNNIFKKAFLLTRIIKYKPTNTKSLFLNKLHNSKIKIITMIPPGASK